MYSPHPVDLEASSVGSSDLIGPLLLYLFCFFFLYFALFWYSSLLLLSLYTVRFRHYAIWHRTFDIPQSRSSLNLDGSLVYVIISRQSDCLLSYTTAQIYGVLFRHRSFQEGYHKVKVKNKGEN